MAAFVDLVPVYSMGNFYLLCLLHPALAVHQFDVYIRKKTKNNFEIGMISQLALTMLGSLTEGDLYYYIR